MDERNRSLELRSKLFALLKERAFRRGRVVLASGRESDFYFDMKPAMLDPELFSVIGMSTVAPGFPVTLPSVTVGPLPAGGRIITWKEPVPTTLPLSVTCTVKV